MSETVDLKPLIAQARSEGKWLWCHYQDIWMSPDELEAANAAGRFLWGAVNWSLRDPRERLAEAQERAARANAAVARIEAEISGY